MSFIRPEVLGHMTRWREVVLGLALAATGGWAIWMGGFFFVPLGVAILAIGVGWSVLALRRMQFGQAGDAPGVVEVDEGQITYFGPNIGGAVGLPELVEIRLLTLRGRRIWRLKQADGQTILIPVEAAGAERLFDAFAALPGMDTSALVGALQTSGPGTGSALVLDGAARVVWQRTARGVVLR
jgi:hypothetical protein